MFTFLPYAVWGTFGGWSTWYFCKLYTDTTLFRRKIDLVSEVPYTLFGPQAQDYVQQAAQWELDSRSPMRYTASRLFGIKKLHAKATGPVEDEQTWFVKTFRDQATLDTLRKINNNR